MNQCKTCGCLLERVGNLYVCPACGNTWEVDDANDKTAVRLANAWEALRQSDFDKSSELFDEIIMDDKKSHEAYWGKALALNGIIFVTDLNENKKLPTCNNITENSFLEDKNVKKAIALAPMEVADNYQRLSEKIEKIRIEWLEKASKEPAYDIFICFKDSDRENGIERTQDSVDAQDLYNALTAEGYKVFFSRVSLRNKISEQFEPYIYNAIKTAKIMIVLGEKPEYFSSVWMKNEWNRFRARIEKGEKHKNSLVVVYKNMDAGDLPIVLKSRQCMDMSNISFFSDLHRHIKKVIQIIEQDIHLDKIKIEGGKMAKKATQIAVNTLKTREIGQGAIAETSLSEKQSVSLINTYLTTFQWAEADSLIEDILFNNPGCAEAIWCSILSHMKAENKSRLKNILSTSSEFKDRDLLEKLLNCASRDFAAEILTLFYEYGYGNDEQYAEILTCILPYSYPLRDEKIQLAFKKSINMKYQKSFDILLSTLDGSNVDTYIDYNLKFAKSVISSPSTCEKYLSRVLAIDEGNVEALKMKFDISLGQDTLQEAVAKFETLLKYSKNTDETVEQYVESMSTSKIQNNSPELLRQILRYYSGSISVFKDYLCKFSYRLLEHKSFKEAEQFFGLLLSMDKNDANIYWGICLMKIGATKDSDVVNQTQLIKDCPEYNKYLALVSEKRRLEVINLSNKQISEIQRRKRDDIASQKSKLLNDIDTRNKKIQYLEDKIHENIRWLKDPEHKGSYMLSIILWILGIALIISGVLIMCSIIFFMVGLQSFILEGIQICSSGKDKWDYARWRTEKKQSISEMQAEVARLNREIEQLRKTEQALH